MQEVSLRQIKEEMRRAIIYYAVDAKKRFGKSNYPHEEYDSFMKSEKFYFRSPSEDQLNEICGSVAINEKIIWPSDFIKNKIYEFYKSNGYEDIAKRALVQVNEDYIRAGLRKYKISTDNIDAEKRAMRRFNSSIKANLTMEEKNSSNYSSISEKISWAVIIVIIVAFLSGLFGFIFGESRSGAEKDYMARCAANGTDEDQCELNYEKIQDLIHR